MARLPVSLLLVACAACLALQPALASEDGYSFASAAADAAASFKDGYALADAASKAAAYGADASASASAYATAGYEVCSTHTCCWFSTHEGSTQECC